MKQFVSISDYHIIFLHLNIKTTPDFFSPVVFISEANYPKLKLP